MKNGGYAAVAKPTEPPGASARQSSISPAITSGTSEIRSGSTDHPSRRSAKPVKASRRDFGTSKAYPRSLRSTASWSVRAIGSATSKSISATVAEITPGAWPDHFSPRRFCNSASSGTFSMPRMYPVRQSGTRSPGGVKAARMVVVM
ncbi:hypothetical protein E0H73_09160 [Kribbella pittospori]|uniref:Uncharacterized protein n=1 Tax=Kribbella pittospori TaxID=722689 RepID=A0A4R0KU63_9ACTN|nr:hypothetical protein [Kribbella pittospori]TCC64543.1 hypothetical protein E0H73_09160 [Kribbella pittospori]